MKKEDLLPAISEYNKLTAEGAAKTPHFTDIKNKIRAAYDAGNISKQEMTDLGKEASFSFKNMGKSPELAKLPSKIAEKGGTVGKLDIDGIPLSGKVVSSAKETSGFGKKLRSFAPLLGMLGAGAAAMGVGQKAMAGDIPGAAGEAADIATDYIPGVSQAKFALESSPLGEGSDVIPAKAEQFDFTPFKTAGKAPAMQQSPEISDSSIDKPNPVRYSDLKKLLEGIKR